MWWCLPILDYTNGTLITSNFTGAPYIVAEVVMSCA